MGSCKNIGNLRLSGPTDSRKRTGKKKKERWFQHVVKGLERIQSRERLGVIISIKNEMLNLAFNGRKSHGVEAMSSSWLRKVTSGQNTFANPGAIPSSELSAALTSHKERRMVFSNMWCHFEQVQLSFKRVVLVRAERKYKTQDQSACLCAKH